MAARLLGLGPEVIRKGDIIYILFGAKVPYILRKVADRSYKVVGDIYVFGLIYNELLKSKDSVKTFKLI